MNDIISGECHCGNVKWSASLPLKVALNCHCSMCRSLSGADYSSWVILPADQFNLMSGSENLTVYKATEMFTKSFCSTCGATVSCINDDKFPDHIYLAKGNIRPECNLAPEIQVYTKDKANWVTIDEGIPVIN